MKIVDKISIAELKGMAEEMYGVFVKAVVDIEKKLLVVDAEMHYDEEQFLLEKGSKQNNLWGINLYPDAYGTDRFIEYDSMINVRSSQGNPSRGVENPTARQQIAAIVQEVIHE